MTRASWMRGRDAAAEWHDSTANECNEIAEQEDSDYRRFWYLCARDHRKYATAIRALVPPADLGEG